MKKLLVLPLFIALLAGCGAPAQEESTGTSEVEPEMVTITLTGLPEQEAEHWGVWAWSGTAGDGAIYEGGEFAENSFQASVPDDIGGLLAVAYNGNPFSWDNKVWQSGDKVFDKATLVYDFDAAGGDTSSEEEPEYSFGFIWAPSAADYQAGTYYFIEGVYSDKDLGGHDQWKVSGSFGAGTVFGVHDFKNTDDPTNHSVYTIENEGLEAITANQTMNIYIANEDIYFDAYIKPQVQTIWFSLAS